MDNIRNLLSGLIGNVKGSISGIQGGIQNLASPNQSKLEEVAKLADLSKKARIGMQQLQQNNQPTQLSENKDTDFSRKARMGMENLQGFQMGQPQEEVLGANTGSTDLGRILDVGKYQGKSESEIPLPPQNIQDLLWEYFPDEATASAVALAGENKGFNPNASNENANGTFDYGLMQNNTATLREMLNKSRYGSQLRAGGVNSPEDVLGDAEKSILASKVTRQYEDDAGVDPWSWWYGWQNNGYNINPSQNVEEVANNPAYFKLREFLDRNPQ